MDVGRDPERVDLDREGEVEEEELTAPSRRRTKVDVATEEL